ncbi:MAG TPA: DNA-processing protein DprA [Chitinophagaceae bacterium]|nr:DNA-processing protein DprA [Chitinophagaceae bacterium]
MNSNLLHQVALTMVPNIGPVQARILVEQFGDATAVFTAKTTALENLEGIGSIRAKNIKSFRDFTTAEKEISFMQQYGITPLFITDAGYPRRLLNCYDPPTLLYYKGTADLNNAKVLAIVGTRSKTEYGRQLTEKLIADLEAQQVLVVSGLALGIDAAAHKAAIKQGMATVAVMAHGLHTVYPAEHRPLAKNILSAGGGLLTEFRSQVAPDKHNFPSRNRVVAGMSDATIVVETDVKGGSMITAELAAGYNRDVFAFPGRTTDTKSAGCNLLIKNNKAMLLTGAADIIDLLGWADKKLKPASPQRALFLQLSADEQKIVAVLQQKETMAIDELHTSTALSNSLLAAAMLQLELQNVVTSLPGKRYRLV